MGKLGAIRTDSQNRMMHALAGQLTVLANTFPDEVPADALKAGDPKEPAGIRWLRWRCLSVSRQPKSSQLTSEQAQEVCLLLQEDIAAVKRGTQGIPEQRAQALIKSTQWDYIGKLLSAISRLKGRYQDMAGSRQRMQQWCVHYLGVAWPQSMRDADVCIEALKGILQRSLPPLETLRQELGALEQIADSLSDFGRLLVADGRKRSRKWGPYQWWKLHEQYQQHVVANPEPEPQEAAS